MNKYNNNSIEAKKLASIGNWFYQCAIGYTNKEPLLLSGIENINILKIHLDNLTSKYPNSNSHTIVPFEHISILEENDNNIILIANRGIDFKKLADTPRQILCMRPENRCSVRDIDILLEKIMQNIERFELKPLLSSEDDNLLYLKKRNPISVIQQDAKSIKNLLSILLHYNRHFYFKNCKHLFLRRYKFNVEKDIDYLVKKKILTARLGIIIYKITRLTDASDKLIGEFYRRTFGTKAKKHSNKEWGIVDTKCYHLQHILNSYSRITHVK